LAAPFYSTRMAYSFPSLTFYWFLRKKYIISSSGFLQQQTANGPFRRILCFPTCPHGVRKLQRRKLLGKAFPDKLPQGTEAHIPVLKKWSCGRAKLPVDVKSEAKQTPSHLSLAASLIATHGRGSGQQGKVRGPYLHHDPLTQVNMAKAAAIVGPTLVGRLGQTFYEYTKAVPKSTVATWVCNGAPLSSWVILHSVARAPNKRIGHDFLQYLNVFLPCSTGRHSNFLSLH